MNVFFNRFNNEKKNLVCSEGNASADRWIGRLASCGWLQNICDTITAAATVAQCVQCEGSGGNISNSFSN